MVLAVWKTLHNAAFLFSFYIVIAQAAADSTSQLVRSALNLKNHNDEVFVSESTTPNNAGRQRRAVDVDYRSVLVVRMLSQPEDTQTAYELNRKLQEYLFDGVSGEIASVRKQMELCSGGRVIFEPAPQGILTVAVSLPPGPDTDIANWKDAAAGVIMRDHFGSGVSDPSYLEQLRSVADHVILILPTTFPTKDFVANAEISSSISIFTTTWCESLSSFMHELGHNLMLRHAGISDAEAYGDTSGYMGWSVAETWAPQKCFNAAQHWALGWYDENRFSYTDGMSLPIQIKLAAFVDHAKVGSDMVVLVNIRDEIYIQFNRAKEYNMGTSMMQDQVVAVRDQLENTRIVAGMDPLSSPVIQIAPSVSVRVCDIVMNLDDWSQVDYAVLVIGDDMNGSGSLCSTTGVAFVQQQQIQTPAPVPAPLIATPSPVLVLPPPEPTFPPFSTSQPIATPMPIFPVAVPTEPPQAILPLPGTSTVHGDWPTGDFAFISEGASKNSTKTSPQSGKGGFQLVGFAISPPAIVGFVAMCVLSVAILWLAIHRRTTTSTSQVTDRLHEAESSWSNHILPMFGKDNDSDNEVSSNQEQRYSWLRNGGDKTQRKKSTNAQNDDDSVASYWWPFQ